nr:PAS domain S-box protein [Siccirubricoccus soli]
MRRLAGPLFGLLAGSDLAVAATDARRPGDIVVYVNPAFTRLTGHAAAEVLGRSCALLQGAEMRTGECAALRAALDRGERHGAEVLARRRDGSLFRSRLEVIPIPDAAGAPAYVLVTQREIAGLRPQPPERGPGRFQFLLPGALANWDWDVAGRVIRGDAGFGALYGIDAEAAAAGIGVPDFFAIIHPEDQLRVRLAIGAVLRGAEVFAKEYRILGPRGGHRWVQARGRMYRDGEGRAAHFLGTLMDITDQKRVEEKLRIAQTAGGIGTFEYVSGFGTVSVSGQFCRLLGLQPAEDLPLRTVNGVVHPEDPKIIEPGTGAGTASQAEFRITRPDTGELRWLQRRGETLLDPETGEVRICGVIYDITEAKLAEERLRTLNEGLEALIAERTADRNRLWHLSGDIMVVAQAEGVMTAVNPAWTVLLGWPEAELVGRQLFELVHEDDRRRMQEEVAALTGTETLRRFDSRCRAKQGGWRWISWSAASNHGLIYAVGRDITEEKERAEALRQAEALLRQAHKMEAIGQLTGGLAHDFNNLLTGIIGGLAMLKLRLEQGRMEQLDRYLTVVQEAASRAAALTHRLLAFSRRQPLDPVATRPNELILGMRELLRRTIGPQISLQEKLAASLWPILCDPNQLENALLNLCINARDAMPEGGDLTIETANVRFNTQTLGDRAIAPGDYVLIAVADTGIGMSPEVVARAFDPFFTTKPMGQGTGLGLSMIYGFAKQSGGLAEIHSQPGIGTTVRLYLPRFLGEIRAQPATDAELPPQPMGLGRTVLVVEDEEAVKLIVCETLRELGFTTLAVSDGRAAVQVLRSERALDLLVTDVGLRGGMNGRQIADVAHELRPGLNILFITGYAENAVVGQEPLEAGMHILTKPFSVQTLMRKVHGILA